MEFLLAGFVREGRDGGGVVVIVGGVGVMLGFGVGGLVGMGGLLIVVVWFVLFGFMVVVFVLFFGLGLGFLCSREQINSSLIQLSFCCFIQMHRFDLLCTLLCLLRVFMLISFMFFRFMFFRLMVFFMCRLVFFWLVLFVFNL